MPTYSYVCKSCAHEFEVQQSFQDQPLDTCPVCGGEVRKVFGKLGVTFKGSGFYRTDSAPKSESSSSD
jgi:putative FmdB family regulatory protein